MDYETWNNIIAKYFFNRGNAGKDIILYVTKQQIIDIGKNQWSTKSDGFLWDDFIRSIKFCDGKWRRDPIEASIELYDKWRLSGKTNYPPYIAYLVLFILPLTDSTNDDVNANNYYGRVNTYLHKHGILEKAVEKISTSNFKLINDLWDDLAHWTAVIKNGDYGIFRLGHFTNPNWIYVGKPFSQIVLPPSAISRLPEMFYEAGLIPDSTYSDEEFKSILLKHGSQILCLRDSVIDILRKSDSNELEQSIIETVRKEYCRWTGEQHETVFKEGAEHRIRKHTVVPLKLQFTISQEGALNLSFRAKYSTEPPPDLKFEEFEDIYENENWSKTFRRPFKESFELKDPNNKWTAKFEFRNIRLLIRGGYYQLGNDFWIETETLSRVEGMYLMCKNDIGYSIKEWCEKCCSEFRDESTLQNLPLGYSLFWFRNPQISHEQFRQLRVYKDKKILLRAGTGLKIGYRTFLNEMLPEVEITNADEKESVYIQYEGSGEKIILQKHQSLRGIWLLPEDLLLHSSFFIQIENEFIEGNRQTYKIDAASFKHLSNDYLPKRNKFTAQIEDGTEFIQGNKIQYSGTINTEVDGQSFSSIAKATIQQETGLKFKDNTLLKWLVGVKDCDIKKYNEAFETVLHDSFTGEQLEVQQKRKSSINLLDYLGYVDYNYESGKIYTLPPKLICVPCKRGRKALLIGGRDEKLINEMIVYCSNSNNKISLSVKKQNHKNLQLLIPDSIIFESNSRSEFLNLANNFQIEFDKWYILKLKNFIPTLSQYEEFITGNGSSESWERFGLARKVFKKDTLKFELVEEFTKEYSLTECRPSYIPEYGLWINESYYTVDKSWGKYLFINHCSEKVRGYGHGNYFSKPVEIFLNSDTLAIPASMPLPKLFSRMILQLSGEAPDFRELNLKGTNVWYNVYRNIPSLFTENFFRFILNMNIETTMQTI